jgi:hypothetical protein
MRWRTPPKLLRPRAHGTIHKIPNSHRYQLTKNGRLLTAALFAMRHVSLQKLVGSQPA